MGRVARVKLLADTHIWLWALLELERLTATVRAALESPNNELRLSPITVWEAALLAERGRLHDQADQLVAATARVLGLTLVTADERLLYATEFDVLANR